MKDVVTANGTYSVEETETHLNAYLRSIDVSLKRIADMLEGDR